MQARRRETRISLTVAARVQMAAPISARTSLVRAIPTAAPYSLPPGGVPACRCHMPSLLSMTCTLHVIPPSGPR